MDSIFIFKNLRAGIDNEHQIVLEGYCNDNILLNRTLKIFLDDDKVYELKYDTHIRDIDQNYRFEFCDESINKTIHITINLPKKFSDSAKLYVMTLENSSDDQWNTLYACGGHLIKKCYRTLCGGITSIKNNGKKNVINGYIADKKEPKITVSTSENFEDSLDYEIEWYDEGKDEFYFVEGNKNVRLFCMTVPLSKEALWIKFVSDNKEYVKRVRPFVKIYKSKYLAKINRYARRTVHSFKCTGIKRTIIKCAKRLSPRQYVSSITYDRWLEDRESGFIKKMQMKKRKDFFDCKIGLILSDGNKNPLANYAVNSLNEQIFKNYEILSANSVDKNVNGIKGYCYLFLDVKDVLAFDALYEVAASFENAHPDIIYCDSDVIDVDLGDRLRPDLKPDFNIDLLRSYNYIGRILGISKEFCDKILQSDLFPELTSIEQILTVDASDYNFILRCVELADNIKHIPKVLYSEGMSRRTRLDNLNKLSVRLSSDYSKMCVRNHLNRLGIAAVVKEQNEASMNDIIYKIKNESLVSIIIPNKDHYEDLARCVNSVLNRSIYSNYEIIIVENNSVEPETFEYYRYITEYSSKVKVVYWKGEFNYSAINNFGARAASGDYLLMLNNDTEMLDGWIIYRLLGHCQREEVGIAGTKLLYENDLIQHAGIIIGMGGIAGNAFAGAKNSASLCSGRTFATSDYSAVTAACLMISSKLFFEIGGFDEELSVAFNDVDLCLKVRRKNKLVVYDANAILRHYESLSRGQEDTEEKLERFYDEIEQFKDRWIDILREGDIYYNKGLSLKDTDFSLAKDNSEVII